jgi:osmoprotectant transport system permease protein
MDGLISFFQYLGRNWADLLALTYDHILMVVIGMSIALVIGILLGIISSKNERLASIILAVANLIQVFPSLALLTVLMLFFGLGFNTVVIGLVLYSLLPIIRNTYVGLKEVDSSITQAGKGVGMGTIQLLFKVQLPLSLPFLLAGVRIAMIISIGVATLAPIIGGDGLGRAIYSGINLRDPMQIYSGAMIAAIIAILADYLLGKAQKKLDKSNA